MGGGGGGGDAGVDAGCPTELCPVDVYRSTRISEASQYPSLGNGLVVASIDRFSAFAGFETGGGAASFYELQKRDGGLVELSRTTELAGTRLVGAAGTPDRYFLASSVQANLYVNGVKTNQAYDCLKADGGTIDFYLYGAFASSASELWLLGNPYQVCQWNGTTPAIERVDPDAVSSSGVYLYDAFRTPSDELLMAGGVYPSQMGVGADSYIYLLDGGTVPGVSDVDPYDYGFVAIDGDGEEVWAVSRSGLVAQRQFDQTFAPAFDAGFSLRALSVRSHNDIWAVGRSGQQAVHFNGFNWSFVELPSSALSPEITWEHVEATDAALFLTGYATTANLAELKWVVHTYRRKNH
jgi:hypothetical protein